MEHCPPSFQPLLQRDLYAAWAAIGIATVDDKERAKSWDDWARYARSANADPYLRAVEKPARINLLLAFAARIRTGLFGKGKPVGY